MRKLVNKISKGKVFEILLILLLSLTPLLWLSGNQVVLGHDSGFRLNPIEYFTSLIHSWNQSGGFGSDWSVNKGFLIAQFPEIFFIWLTKSLSIGQRLSFVFWFFTIGISMYVFVNNFFKERKYWILRIFASTFYVYNFFLLQAWFIAERAKFSLFALLPFGLLIICRTLTKRYSIIKGTILFSVATFLLNGGGSVPLYGSIIVGFLGTFTYFMVAGLIRNGISGLIYPAKVVMAFLIGALFINAYWIVPQAGTFFENFSQNLSAIGGVEGILEWEKVISKNSSPINIFRLQGMPDWYNDTHLYSRNFLENPILVIASFAPIALFLWGMRYLKDFVDRKRKSLVYLVSTLFLMSLVFTAGSHPPTGFLYLFFMKYIPGFVIFRSAFYKFATLTWFSLIFLSALGLNLIILKHVKQKTFKKIFGFFMVIFLLFYHFPFFTVNFFNWNEPFSTKVEVPSYVYAASDYFRNNLNEDSRVLLLPPFDNRFLSDSYQWGFWSLWSLPKSFSNVSVLANDVDTPGIIKGVYKTIEDKDEVAFLNLAGIMGIDHVLWRDDVLYNDKITTSKEVSGFEENLSTFDSTQIVFSEGDWRLYRVDSQSHRGKVSASSDLVYSFVESTSIAPVLETIGAEKKVLVENKSLSGGLTEKIKGISNELIIQPSCIFCDPGEFQRKIDEIRPPYVRLLPGSTFYSFIEMRERLIFRKNRGNPAQRIDVDISFAHKRMGEIQRILVETPKEDLNRLLNLAVERYINHIDDGLKELASLPAIDRNFYSIRLITFLRGHNQIWPTFAELGRADEAAFAKLAEYTESVTSELEKEVWVTQSDFVKRYYLSVASDGAYKIHLGDRAPKEIRIDEKVVRDLEKINLEQGLHKLEVEFEEPNDLLVVTGEGDTFSPQKNERFSIGDFDYRESYVISFEYRATSGISPKLVLSQNNDPINLDGSRVDLKKDLHFSDTWKSFRYRFKPNLGAINGYISFSYKAFGKKDALLVRDLKVYKNPLGEIFFTKTLKGDSSEEKDIRYNKISPSEYLIEVSNIKEPFVLIFGDKFTMGWRLYNSDTRKFLDGEHFESNGYSNGWYIDGSKDRYKLKLVYWPQRHFVYGSYLTGLSLLLVIYLVVKKRK